MEHRKCLKPPTSLCQYSWIISTHQFTATCYGSSGYPHFKTHPFSWIHQHYSIWFNNLKSPAQLQHTKHQKETVQLQLFDEALEIEGLGAMAYLVGWLTNYGWLVVDLPLWKMMEWKSVGMMTVPTEWKNETCSKPPTRYGSVWKWGTVHPQNIK